MKYSNGLENKPLLKTQYNFSMPTKKLKCSMRLSSIQVLTKITLIKIKCYPAIFCFNV